MFNWKVKLKSCALIKRIKLYINLDSFVVKNTYKVIIRECVSEIRGSWCKMMTLSRVVTCRTGAMRQCVALKWRYRHQGCSYSRPNCARISELEGRASGYVYSDVRMFEDISSRLFCCDVNTTTRTTSGDRFENHILIQVESLQTKHNTHFNISTLNWSKRN